MNIRSLAPKLLWLLIAACILSCAFAQETTAGLQGTLKDPTGAIITGATVEVAGPALIGTKKVQTDSSGYFRFANLPPGPYTITVTSPGFRTYKQNITLEVGHLPSLEISMAVGQLTETVEVSEQAAMIDVSQSKVQTNIPSATLENLPKGRSFP